MAGIKIGIGFDKALGRSSLWFSVAGLIVAVFFQLLLYGAFILYGLGPIFCIGFSALRLSEHDYGDADGVAANKAKLRSALLIFYSLVLLQTICFSTWVILQAILITQVDKIITQCGFGKWGEVVSGYLRETKVKCATNLRLPGDWNLITYAVGLLESASPDDQLAAARVLDTLGGEEVSVRLELQSSRRSIKNLIGMLGWRSPDDREIRERAARIIADVSGELHITQFPEALQCISSLLDASQQDHDQETLALSLEGSSESSETSVQNDHDQGETAHQNSHNQGETARQNGDQQVLILSSGSSHRRTTGDKMNKTQKFHLRYLMSREFQMKRLLGVEDSFVPNGPKELIFQGVLILERLTQDQDNCSEICRNQGLVSQITGPITSNTFLDTDYDDTWVYILSTSLGMVSRLVSTPGEASQSLRHEIGRSKEAARNMLGILESGNNGYLRLQEQAIEILAEVALDMPTTTTNSFIRMLRCIFLDDANNSSNVVEENKQRTRRMRKKAGEALAKLLCVQGASNSKAIMEMFWENGNVAVEQDPADSLEATRHGNVVDQLTDILAKNKLCQISAAEILEHLCSHFTKYRELPKQDVINLLTKVTLCL